MLEKMMMGITEMKPSRIALRYLLRAMALKNGLPFSMVAMSCSISLSFQEDAKPVLCSVPRVTGAVALRLGN